jgi:hypothetical protein
MAKTSGAEASKQHISDGAEPETFVSPPLRIISARAGFRRGGLTHSAGPTDYPEGEFTLDQIRAFEAEPLLQVTPIHGSLVETIEATKGEGA